ncbi:hypothetical protein [Fibrivirga algicola]|uniref:Uncharacterized protein n=1 Tax=Fibrivirga algicola TaxID=2950420 RepID=A0ABX0QC01_9BACT|nr:hypothetical protein [Fibrivirga algicola]NID09462.1 hypothetical protein [Fibrivirga algicola]
MLRVFIDREGGGHRDLFLKIDVMISHLAVADSYYLYDFLELTETDLQNIDEDRQLSFAVTSLIEYWIVRIQALEKGQRTFLVFDLSDQYIGGVSLEKVKRGYNMKVVYATELQGGITKSKLDACIVQTGAVFRPSDEREWLIGEEALFNGLNWSLNELKR